MPFLRMSEEDMQTSLRVMTYTPAEAMDARQKGYRKHCFLRMVAHLLLTDACIAAVFLLGLLIFCLPGLYFGVRALMDIRTYGELAIGKGLRTVYLFSPDRLRMMECEQMAEVPYSEMASVVLFDAGLVLRFRDGSGRVISPKALEAAECGEELENFLRRKLGNRYRNKFREPTYQLRLQEERRIDLDRRVEQLGRQLTEVSYDVDNIDRRDYCRLVMKTGTFGAVIRVLIPVLGALATAAPFAALVTGNPAFYGICYLLVFVLLLLLLPSVIGLGGPAKERFLAGDEETLVVYVHEKGVYAEGRGRQVLVHWPEMSALRYHPDVGMAFDFGKQGVVFLPVDMTSEEMFDVIRQKAEQSRDAGRPGQQKTRLKDGED